MPNARMMRAVKMTVHTQPVRVLSSISGNMRRPFSSCRGRYWFIFGDIYHVLNSATPRPLALDSPLQGGFLK